MFRSHWPGAVLTGWMLIVAPLVVAAPPKEEVPWKVQLDPLPWKVEPPKAADKTFSFPGNGSVEFALSPSPFCLLHVPGGKNADSELKIIDVRSMEQVGKTVTTKIPVDSHRPADRIVHHRERGQNQNRGA
jgi:hypothetical protein